MATIQVNSIIARAATLIQDATGIRWPAVELLDWLNDGQREIVLLKPQACVKNESVALTAGSTKQVLPASGVMLIDVVRNMGANGTTSGDAIRVVSREVLDAQIPTWHSDANSAGKIKHFAFDLRDPKTYYVYPKAPATAHYVEIIYSAAPANCTAGGAIQIDDIYSNALLDYVLYRAYSKDAEYAQNANLAVAHYAAFANSLGAKTQNELAQDPSRTVQGINPGVPRQS